MAIEPVTPKSRACEVRAFWKITLSALAAAAALWGVPASAAKKAVDGYQFEKAEYVNTEFTVIIVEYDSLKDSQAAAVALGVVIPDSGNPNTVMQVGAWTRILRKRNVCEIHIVKASAAYEPQWLGHELAHCIYGRWHR